MRTAAASRSAAGACVAAVLLATSSARAGGSADELLRQARAHEAAHEDAIAVRRYMEALELEPRLEDAWLGLGGLRLRSGDAAEAERVYGAALARVPTMTRAAVGRARARFALGRRAEAEADLEGVAAKPGALAVGDVLRELAGWYGVDGRTPPQLAAWRRLLALAADEAAVREARAMVRALVLLVGDADPAASPPWADPFRRAMAARARRAE